MAEKPPMKTFLFWRGNSRLVVLVAKRKTAKAAKNVKTLKAEPKENPNEFKLALAILIFGTATAVSAIYKTGNMTILLGLVTAAAALAMTVSNR